MLNGFKVVYAGEQSLFGFTVTLPVTFYPLKTNPFIYPVHVAEVPGYAEPSGDWYKKISRASTRARMAARKQELKTLLERYQPAIVFIDSSYYADFILLYALNPAVRCIFLDVRFPSYAHDRFIPPSNTFAFPEKYTPALWLKQRIQTKFKILRRKIRYLGNDKYSVLSRKFQELNIPTQYTIILKKLFYPAFREIEEWCLFPKQMDFPNRRLFPWQRYVPLGINSNRFETVSEECRAFVAGQQARHGTSLIYCSLGTVSDVHVKKAKKENVNLLIEFYQKLINVAQVYPQWYFAIAVSKTLMLNIQHVPENVYLSDWQPQQYLLKHATLMINHAGGSIHEAALNGVPMLVLPLGNKWDLNGNAARVVYHGLGLRASTYDSAEKLGSLISTILADKDMAQRVALKAEELEKVVADFDIAPLLSASAINHYQN